MSFKTHSILAAAGLAGAFAWTTAAQAQQGVVVTPAQPAPQPSVVVQPQPPPAPPPPNVVVQTPQAAPPPQQPVVVQSQPPPATTSSSEPVIVNNGAGGTEGHVVHHHFTPDRRMLWSGIVITGISYGAGLVVAGSSAHAGDSALYVPVFGPWIDIASRGSCGGANDPCTGDEGANKAGLVIDGVFQAIGAGLILSAFLIPEEPDTTVTTTAKAAPPPKPTVHVTPAEVGRGAPGMAVFGTF